MTKAIIHTYVTIHAYRRQISLALAALCVSCIALYSVLLYQVISRTVAIQETNAVIADVSSAVRTLDSQYLALSRTITPDRIVERGLHIAEVSDFISHTVSRAESAFLGYEH